MQKITMTPEQLDAFMAKSKLNPHSLANTLGITKPAVDHWLSGRREVPAPVVKLLRVMETYPQLIPYVESLT